MSSLRQRIDQADQADGALLDNCYDDAAANLYPGQSTITEAQEATIYADALGSWNFIRNSQGQEQV